MAENQKHECKQEKVIEIILDKLDSLDSFREIITEVKTLVVVQNKHLDKLDAIIEKQNERSDKQDLILSDIAVSMKSITDEQKTIKFDVQELKKDNTVEIKVLPLIKKIILKVVFPTSAIGFLIYEAAKVLKIIK
jgi:hypothetical protein